jgi:hypothetical protein
LTPPRPANAQSIPTLFTNPSQNVESSRQPGLSNTAADDARVTSRFTFVFSHPKNRNASQLPGTDLGIATALSLKALLRYV